MKSGNLNFLEPSGLLQACNGTDLPFNSNPVTVVWCCSGLGGERVQVGYAGWWNLWQNIRRFNGRLSACERNLGRSGENRENVGTKPRVEENTEDNFTQKNRCLEGKHCHQLRGSNLLWNLGTFRPTHIHIVSISQNCELTFSTNVEISYIATTMCLFRKLLW